MCEVERSQSTEVLLAEARRTLAEILDILQRDVGGYEDQRQRIYELARRCLQIMDDPQNL